MQRLEMLAAIAERLLKIERTHPVRIGIDGVTASGKTTLADELAAELTTSSGRQVIRGSVDDFHNPPEVRYRRGRMSPEGYYLDAFDHASLRNLLLDPLGSHRSLHYCVGAFGQPNGTAADFEERRAPDDAILIVDGVFLYRPELNDCWDYRVFLEVDPALAIARGLARDAAWMGGLKVARARYEQRYVPGERLYLDTVRPWEVADVVVTNDVFEAPAVRFRE